MPARVGQGVIPLAWRGLPCLDSSQTGRRLGRHQTVVLVVVGMSKEQGLLAKTLRGEPKALHGDGDVKYGTL